MTMCELLGMECNVLTDIVFSFSGLSGRGGKHGPHADGWGLALYDGRVARVFLDPGAASESPLAKFVREHPTGNDKAREQAGRALRGELPVEGRVASRGVPASKPKRARVPRVSSSSSARSASA